MSFTHHWRLLHGIGFLIAVVMLGSALYLQIVEFVMPCVLCIYLRVITIFYGLISLIAMLCPPRSWGQKVYLRVCLFCSLFGIALSLYLLSIQMHPIAKDMSCGQGIEPTLINWPFGTTLGLLFSPYSDCAEMPWTLFGLTLPLLSLLSFVGLFLFELLKRWIIKAQQTDFVG
jgi:disulfide bond formation protein DsbB